VCEQLALTDALHCPCCIILFVFLRYKLQESSCIILHCFVGSIAVTGMVSHGLARDRQEAIQLGNAMLVSTKAYCKLTVTYFVCFTCNAHHSAVSTQLSFDCCLAIIKTLCDANTHRYCCCCVTDFIATMTLGHWLHTPRD
jgi:hypothetical protein